MFKFRAFEQPLTAVQKESVTYDEGYAQPGESYEKTFKGVLVDRATDTPEFQGVRLRGDRILYLRLSQEWVPDLQLDDIIIDKDGRKWKIVDRYDYSIEANCKVFGVTRVEP